MQGLRGRKDQDDRVTISQVLIESRNLSDRDDAGVGGGGSCTGISGTGGVGGFDLPDNTNYFAHSFEWARYPHRLLSRPFPRIFGGASAAEQVCSATGLLMHDSNEPSIASNNGGAVVTATQQPIHREMSPPVRADGEGADERPDRPERARRGRRRGPRVAAGRVRRRRARLTRRGIAGRRGRVASRAWTTC